MIKLQNKDRFDEVAYLDPKSGEVRILPKGRPPDSTRDKIQGSFSNTGNHTLYLYRVDEVLYLRVDNLIIDLSEQTKINLVQADGNINKLVVLRDGMELLALTYARPKLDPPLSVDPTPFVEDEDYDFHLFVSNVVKNPRRKATIYR